MGEQIDVVVSHEVTTEQLKELFTVIGSRGPTGCRTCGIQGLDIRLRAQEVELEDLPATVRSIVSTPGEAA